MTGPFDGAAVGAAIHHRRQQIRRPIQVVADMALMNRATLSRVEAGLVPVTAGMLDLLAAALDTHPYLIHRRATELAGGTR